MRRGRLRRGGCAAGARAAPTAAAAVPSQAVLDVLLTTMANLGGAGSAETPFMEAGIDSLGAVQLRNEMTAAFGLDLPPTVTFDYPTPAALAGYIASQVAGAGESVVEPPQTAAPAAADGSPAAAAAPPPAGTRQPSAAVLLPDVLEIVAGIVGAALDAEDPLMASGLDSLGAVQLRNAVSERFGVELPATAALDFPTPSALAGFVAQGLAPTGAAGDAWAGAEVSFYSDDEAGGSGVTEVTGLACMYPGQAGAEGSGAAGFWRSALGGDDLPCAIPYNRWDVDRHYAPDVTGAMHALLCSSRFALRDPSLTPTPTPPAAAVDKMAVRFAAFIPGVEAFDAALFRLSASEAAPMDPQGRVLLEQAHLALADAGDRGGTPLALDTGL